MGATRRGGAWPERGAGVLRGTARHGTTRRAKRSGTGREGARWHSGAWRRGTARCGPPYCVVSCRVGRSDVPPGRGYRRSTRLPAGPARPSPLAHPGQFATSVRPSPSTRRRLRRRPAVAAREDDAQFHHRPSQLQPPRRLLLRGSIVGLAAQQHAVVGNIASLPSAISSNPIPSTPPQRLLPHTAILPITTPPGRVG